MQKNSLEYFLPLPSYHQKNEMISLNYDVNDQSVYSQNPCNFARI